MFDLHCHILPGIDDGAAGPADTLALARRQLQEGVTTVAATPHVGWQWANRAATIRDGLVEVTALLDREDVGLHVVPGAEVAMDIVTDLDDEELGALTLGEGDWILLECPHGAMGARVDRPVQHVQARGFRVLLAHPERSPLLQRKPQLLADLVRGGARAQVTAGSLSGAFGSTVRTAAMGMVEAGLVANVSSDAHDVARRPPGLLGALAAAGLEDYAEYWCSDVPAAILAGEPLPQPPRAFRPAPAR